MGRGGVKSGRKPSKVNSQPLTSMGVEQRHH